MCRRECLRVSGEEGRAKARGGHGHFSCGPASQFAAAATGGRRPISRTPVENAVLFTTDWAHRLALLASRCPLANSGGADRRMEEDRDGMAGGVLGRACERGRSQRRTGGEAPKETNRLAVITNPPLARAAVPRGREPRRLPAESSLPGNASRPLTARPGALPCPGGFMSLSPGSLGATKVPSPTRRKADWHMPYLYPPLLVTPSRGLWKRFALGRRS